MWLWEEEEDVRSAFKGRMGTANIGETVIVGVDLDLDGAKE